MTASCWRECDALTTTTTTTLTNSPRKVPTSVHSVAVREDGCRMNNNHVSFPVQPVIFSRLLLSPKPPPPPAPSAVVSANPAPGPSPTATTTAKRPSGTVQCPPPYGRYEMRCDACLRFISVRMNQSFRHPPPPLTKTRECGTTQNDNRVCTGDSRDWLGCRVCGRRRSERRSVGVEARGNEENVGERRWLKGAGLTE